MKARRNQRALGKWQGAEKTTGRWGKTTGCCALSFRPSENPVAHSWSLLWGILGWDIYSEAYREFSVYENVGFVDHCTKHLYAPNYWNQGTGVSAKLLLSKLWKAKFFILCDVIFLVGLQGEFEIDHSRAVCPRHAVQPWPPHGSRYVWAKCARNLAVVQPAPSKCPPLRSSRFWKSGVGSVGG